MKLGAVGSRYFNDYTLMATYIKAIDKHKTITQNSRFGKEI